MKFHVCSKEFDSGHKGKNFCLEQCVHHEEEAEGDTGQMEEKARRVVQLDRDRLAVTRSWEN